MRNIAETLFDLIAAEVCGKEADPEVFRLSDEELEKLYRLSRGHDMAHLAGDYLLRHRLIESEERKAQFEKQVHRAIYRYEKLNHGYEQIKALLCDAGIAFLPLKGTVLRAVYPEAWMRTSCDIDILVHEEDLFRLCELAEKKAGYTIGKKTPHNIDLFSPGGVHIELHYTLIESGTVGKADIPLQKIWEYAKPQREGSCCLELPDEWFTYYHIAHMAKHFQIGGCGIRPFLDLWILNHRVPHDRQKRAALLTEGGLLPFAEACERLSEIWFGNAEHTETTRQMEAYILHGGVYGTAENRVMIQQHKKGGKLKYALSKIFLPYDTIKFHYPILQKHRFLTPVMEVRRWGKLLFCGGVRRSARELRLNAATTKETQSQTENLLSVLGLENESPSSY